MSSDIPIDTIIFDLGEVLIDWDPRYLYRKIFKTEEEANFFATEVCPYDWNTTLDAGKTFAEALPERIALFPKYEKEILAYRDRWAEMLGESRPDSVELFKKLKDSGNYKIYALTNFSAETFPHALKKYDFLSWFDGAVVSGEIKMIKPNSEIYLYILDKFEIDPEKALFVDDRIENVEAAREFGIHSIHYQNPKQMLEDFDRYL